MKKTVSVVICLFLSLFSVSAHQGRTDSSGGHYVRATGEYHYHHGYEAHQHPGGVCPYASSSQPSTPSPAAVTVTASVPYADSPGDYGPEAETEFETKRDAHHSGFEWGVEYSFDDENPNSAYSNGYNDGYKQGYSEGENDGQDAASDAAYDYGYDSGYNDGYDDGRAAGYDKGKANEAQAREGERFLWVCAVLALLAVCNTQRGRCADLQRHVSELESLCREEKKKRQRVIEAAREEFRLLKAALSARDDAPSALPAPAAPPAPAVPAAPPAVPPSFGAWPPSVHQTDAQYKRYQRSKSDDFEILTQSDDGYVIQGTSDVYITTLDSCTCPDFTHNLHGQAPCKHIYFLAHEQGIDVASIFLPGLPPRYNMR